MNKFRFVVKKKINRDFFIDVLLLFGVVFSCTILLSPNIISEKNTMQVYGLLCLVLIMKTFWSSNIITLGPVHILILYVIVSCFGYDVLVLLGGNFFYTTISGIRHAYIDYFNKANALYFLGSIALVYGVVSIKRNNNLKNITILKKRLSFTNFEKYLFMRISFYIVWMYSALLLFFVITGRIPLTGYAEVRDWFSTQPMLSYLLRLTWVAIPTYFFFANSKNEYTKFSIPLLIMFLILMITGNRNEILYPLAVAVGVYVWKRNCFENKRKLPKFVMIGALIIIFIFNPLISSTRQTGFNITDITNFSFGVSDVLLELGQQINPFSIILYALDQGITTFKYGMTLIVPTVSILSLNLIWGTSIYNTSIVYNPTILLNSLGHYGRGFSFIAEFYYNFGFFGMIFIMYVIGRYMGKRENAPFSKWKLLFYFQIMPLFMVISRNICGYNILNIIFALLLNFIVKFIIQKKERG